MSTPLTNLQKNAENDPKIALINTKTSQLSPVSRLAGKLRYEKAKENIP